MANRARCARCPRPLPAQRYTIEGERVCGSCYKRHTTPVRRCPRCQRVIALSGYIDGARVCAACEATHRNAVPTGRCAECNAPAHLVKGLCDRHYQRLRRLARPAAICIDCHERKPLDGRHRCTTCANTYRKQVALEAQLTKLLGSARRRSTAGQRLYRHLTEHRAPQRVLRWLKALAEPVRAALHEIGHGALPVWDELQPLRRLAGGEQLVATCLRAQLVQAPIAQTDRIAQLLVAMRQEGPRAAAISVAAFWRFYLSQRVAPRRTRRRVDPTLESDRTTLKIAFRFLRFILVERGLELAKLTQKDLTLWIRQARPSHVQRLRPFLRWLRTGGTLAHTLVLPEARISAATPTPAPIYTVIQRRARTDSTLALLLRVVLLLICQCARYPFEIVRLQRSALRRDANGVQWIHFARGLPQPLEGTDGQLITDYCNQLDQSSPWLFPSKPRPEAHLTAHGLGGLLHDAGVRINLRELRNAACRDLLRDFTPTELTEILGMTPGVAHHWEKRVKSVTPTQKAYVNKLSRAAQHRAAARPRAERPRRS